MHHDAPNGADDAQDSQAIANRPANSNLELTPKGVSQPLDFQTAGQYIRVKARNLQSKWPSAFTLPFSDRIVIATVQLQWELH